jgi:anti-sigma B factor antagonist
VRIAVRFNEDIAVVSLSGKFLAGSDGPYLRQKVKDLIDAGTKKLVIEFSDVPYIDSTGLGFLAGARVTAQNAEVRLVLCGLNSHVRKILDDVNLAQFFTIAKDEAAAAGILNETAGQTGQTAESAKREPKGKKRSSAAPEA